MLAWGRSSVVPRSSIEAAVTAEADLIHAWLRSNYSTLVPVDPETDWTIRQRPRDNPDTKEEEFKEEEEELKVLEPMVEQLVNEPPPMRRPMKHAFIPQKLDQPSCIAYQLYMSLSICLPTYSTLWLPLETHLMRIHTCILGSSLISTRLRTSKA